MLARPRTRLRLLALGLCLGAAACSSDDGDPLTAEERQTICEDSGQLWCPPQ